LDAHSDMQLLCTRLARTLVQMEDDGGHAVFPLNGTRVLAYPAPHHAVADGAADKVFVYLNLRITPGRDAALVERVGKALLAQVDAHFAPLSGKLPVRITLHIDEGHPVYEGKWASA
jgi:5-carboxymethyl-2-hydroxymuconate isomerase